MRGIKYQYSNPYSLKSENYSALLGRAMEEREPGRMIELLEEIKQLPITEQADLMKEVMNNQSRGTWLQVTRDAGWLRETKSVILGPVWWKDPEGTWHNKEYHELVRSQL